MAYLPVINLKEDEYLDNNYLIFCTKNGIIKKTTLRAYSNVRKGGVNAIEIREGDEVLMHGVPTDVAFGTRLVMQCNATVHRAGVLERAWTRLAGLFELTELYEVGFQPKDAIDNGFFVRGTR